ncbi:acetolactate decarboxylase [Vibrio sp. MEBiC08052]|uniref:acetolactate decarboxylase n=1 Tax=Vibrio sp. MEBiC08052 TaxID=1761910 RepID=UPI0007407EBA|nr:acetolactate decarboxylase [Vibrio sp. MEBiC08052]KUI99676.1 hypothetical protein VRK_11220 [Vibrio sp. MEBiC08052]
MNNTVYQISLFGATFEGLLNGITTLNKIDEFGNFGIGGIEGLEGEITLYNDMYYVSDYNFNRKKYDVSENEISTPKMCLTMFSDIKKVNFSKKMSLNELVECIKYHFGNINLFAAIKISSKLASIKLLSYPKSQHPYPKIEELVTRKHICEYKNIDGSLIGFIYPKLMSPITGPEFHFHFIGNSLNIGGHVLSCEIENASVEVSIKDRLRIYLPEHDEFEKISINNPIERLNNVISLINN